MPTSTKIAPSVAISISESSDLCALGLSLGHLHDARAEIALCLLAAGKSLSYSGALRRYGFTEFLDELLIRYVDHPQHDKTIGVTDYLAWPVHIQMSSTELEKFNTKHKSVAQIVYLDLNGARVKPEQTLALPERKPLDKEWSKGLTAMRKVMLKESQARVVLGGRIEGFKGSMPGIAEEVYLSLLAGQPVFVIGGFGGCARGIAETMGLAERWTGSRDDWIGQSKFVKYTYKDLRNGLSKDENVILGTTPHICEAVDLVIRGINRIQNEKQAIA